MTSYNFDFLLAGQVILLMVLYHFFTQKRLDDRNNRIFCVMLLLGGLDVLAELSSVFCIMSGFDRSGTATAITTTVFYLFQALLPYVLVCYVWTLRNNKVVSVWQLALGGLPTLVLFCIILLNPFTRLLFYVDQEGYQGGPWYMLMYCSALCHILVALGMILLWRKDLGKRQVSILVEMLLLCSGGVVLQALDNSVLMTGFGMSLSILSLSLTINNPNTNTDSLTGLYDKQYLVRKLDELIAEKKEFHIITVSLYQLNHVNKLFGMEGGNQLLQGFAGLLQDHCGTEIFRVSGKRFLMLSQSLQEYEDNLLVLRQFLGQEPRHGAELALLPTPAVLTGILNAGKMGSGGAVIDYTEYLESLSQRTGATEVIQDDIKTLDSFLYSKEVENYLHRAVEKDLFEVYYQPVYSVQEQRFITLEALSRLHHPKLGWIAPDVFIQLAEKNRLIEQITELQLHRVCRFMQENQQVASCISNVKMNLSPLDLLRPNCSSHFIRIIDSYALPHSLFQFEVTETVATEYSKRLSLIAEQFRSAGIGLCLDDFGSGYANLNTVTQLPFSVIKLDRSLLFGICSDGRSASFYHSIVSTFQSMGYYVVAEGVETEAEVSLLRQWGVDMIQGYYFAKPLPPRELTDLLTQS